MDEPPQGSYAKLDGGSTMWALEALTGDYVFEFRLDPKVGGMGRGAYSKGPGIALRNLGRGLGHKKTLQ